jgi:hypothetical protein
MDRFAFLRFSAAVRQKMIAQTRLAKLSIPELAFVLRLTATRSFAIRTSSQLDSVLKNDDRCNVRKEAISRDVEGTSMQKVVSLQSESVNAK